MTEPKMTEPTTTAPTTTAPTTTKPTTKKKSPCNNMVSNLPLLFAGGYPTSLERMSESQLEKFLPFMVKCSLGYIQFNCDPVFREPEWWPERVPFTWPLQKPAHETQWMNKMKSLVLVCYKFHSSIFLLRFCQQLATYQPESLRFVSNQNNTTSLFERSSNKLLVTFRNENMMYDQYDQVLIKGKITLLSSKKMNPESKIVEEKVEEKVEEETRQTIFEIYLCDNCEAELYSKEAYDEHEKTCPEDDDVIFCGEEFLTNPVDMKVQQSIFLQNFSLLNPDLLLPSQIKTPKKNMIEESSSSGKHRRKPRCSQIVLSSNIPFSSPAGQQLIKVSNSYLTENYIQEKLERYERYCCAPPLSDDSSNSWLKPVKYNRIPVTFRRPQDQIYRWYTFPRRQYYQSWYRQAFLNLNINELKLCKPVTVKLKKLTSNDIEAVHSQNRCKRMIKMGHEEKTILHNLNIVDVIDLCSDDDDKEFSSNDAQLGNVILSQTATTPASKLSSAASLQTTFDMYSESSSQGTMSMYNPDESYQYQHHEKHQSFLNGAQGSIVTQIDKLTELTDISMQTISSANQAISIDLTL